MILFADIQMDDVLKWLGIASAGLIALVAFLKDHFQHNVNAEAIKELKATKADKGGV